MRTTIAFHLSLYLCLRLSLTLYGLFLSVSLFRCQTVDSTLYSVVSVGLSSVLGVMFELHSSHLYFTLLSPALLCFSSLSFTLLMLVALLFYFNGQMFLHHLAQPKSTTGAYPWMSGCSLSGDGQRATGWRTNWSTWRKIETVHKAATTRITTLLTLVLLTFLLTSFFHPFFFYFIVFFFFWGCAFVCAFFFFLILFHMYLAAFSAESFIYEAFFH